MDITQPTNAELQSPPSTSNTTAPTIKVWKPWTIGGTTVLIGVVFQPEWGIAVGFTLAVINWYRMRQRRTAILNLLVGLLLVIATAAVRYYFERQTWVPSTAEFGVQLVAGFVWLFCTAAYLHLATARDLARAEAHFVIRPASQWVAAGIVAAVLILSVLLRPVVHAGVARAMTVPLQTTSRFTTRGAFAVHGVVHAWANAPVANRHIVLCGLEERRYDPVAPYVCTLTQLTATTDQQGQFSIDIVPAGRYLVFYDSGLADFQAGVEKWADHRMPLEPYAGWAEVFRSYEYRPSMYPPPATELNDFYYLYSEATLMLGGSPFVLAHDIQAASTYKEEIETWRPLPPGVFIPTVIEVHEGQTSEVEFDVLKWQE
jgi:hypothetical protein